MVDTGKVARQGLVAVVGTLIVVGAACARRPPPPPSPPPAYRAVAVWVPGVAHPIVYLDQIGTVTGDSNGYAGFPSVPESLKVVPYLTITATGYHPYRVERVPLRPGNYQMNVGVELPPLQHTFVFLPRLVARGQFIGLENGQRFTAIEATDFALYEKHLKGINIDPVLKQRASLGYNMVRVFGTGTIPFPDEPMNLIPSLYGERYFTELPVFFQRLARQGLYAEFVAFAGHRSALPTKADELVYWTRLVEALRPITNVILEAVNEHDQLGNRVESLQELLRPVGILTSHGSSGVAGANGADPVMPYWDYISLHTNGVPEWQRKAGHNCMELSANTPCTANENTRAPDRFQSPALAFDAAAGAALLAAGSCFHSLNGRISRLWEGLELDLAKAWVDGAQSVPLACQAGPYVRRDDLLTPSLLRVYERRIGDPACIVRIRR